MVSEVSHEQTSSIWNFNNMPTSKVKQLVNELAGECKKSQVTKREERTCLCSPLQLLESKVFFPAWVRSVHSFCRPPSAFDSCDSPAAALTVVFLLPGQPRRGMLAEQGNKCIQWGELDAYFFEKLSACFSLIYTRLLICKPVIRSHSIIWNYLIIVAFDCFDIHWYFIIQIMSDIGLRR